MMKFITHPLMRAVAILSIYLSYGNFWSFQQQHSEAKAANEQIATPVVIPSPSTDCSTPRSSNAKASLTDDKCELPKKAKAKKH